MSDPLGAAEAKAQLALQDQQRHTTLLQTARSCRGKMGWVWATIFVLGGVSVLSWITSEGASFIPFLIFGAFLFEELHRIDRRLDALLDLLESRGTVTHKRSC